MHGKKEEKIENYKVEKKIHVGEETSGSWFWIKCLSNLLNLFTRPLLKSHLVCCSLTEHSLFSWHSRFGPFNFKRFNCLRISLKIISFDLSTAKIHPQRCHCLFFCYAHTDRMLSYSRRLLIVHLSKEGDVHCSIDWQTLNRLKTLFTFVVHSFRLLLLPISFDAFKSDLLCFSPKNRLANDEVFRSTTNQWKKLLKHRFFCQPFIWFHSFFFFLFLIRWICLRRRHNMQISQIVNRDVGRHCTMLSMECAYELIRLNPLNQSKK